MRPRNGRRVASAGTGALFLGVAVASFGAVGVALISQHVFDMQPCPWCVLQRLLFVAIGMLAVAGSVLHPRLVRALAAGAIGGLALCGITAALWQHFKAAASASCNLTLADKVLSDLRLDTTWPNIFEPRASCADAAVNLLGMPYDLWSFALFVAIALAAIVLLKRRSTGLAQGQLSRR